jgi:uncharacterized protein YkwD
MKNTAIAAVLIVLIAVPLSAALPNIDEIKAELAGKKKRTTVVRLAPPPLSVIDANSFEGRLLQVHNAERKRMGIAPLSWSRELAGQAGSWAQSLASKGSFEHSKNRGNVGENLWMGTSGYYQPEAMIGAFVGEKQYFRPGKFPDVSTTGNWSDVGHYTQLIWPGTKEVGCAKATARGNDVLVCRYAPAGNVMGQQVP